MLILALLVGCTNDNAVAPNSFAKADAPPPTKASATENPALVVLERDDDEGTWLAALSGTLANVNGCLGFAPRKRSATGTVLILPSSTTIVNRHPFQVRIHGETYEIGDAVEFTGGGASELRSNSTLRQTAPKSCLGGPFAYIG